MPPDTERTPWLSRISAESGFTAMAGSCRDTKILCMQRFVRLFAYGASFLILVHFLSGLDISDERIGLFMTMTLLGDVCIGVLLTAITDKVGRRKVLCVGAALMAMSGVVFSLSNNFWFLLLASIVGVISPSGNEIGPFRAVEESILAQLTDKEVRSDIFVWYQLLGTAGTAMGTMMCGWLIQLLEEKEDWSQQDAYRVIFTTYAGLGFLKLALVLMLSPKVEVDASRTDYHSVPAEENEEQALMDDDDDDDDLDSQHEGDNSLRRSRSLSVSASQTNPSPSLFKRFTALLPHISPLSRSILYRLLVLFCIDAFASGMAAPSWLTYFFTTIHSLKPGTLGTLFLITNLLATFSNFTALPLARRIGPLKTMVFTHLPSGIFLAMIPFPPPGSFGTPLAMGLLSLRACTQSMDSAPRQAFISAAVLPSERTAVLGVVNAVKTLAQAGGIGSAGLFAGMKLWIAVMAGAGAMKVTYDLLMLWMFLGLKDREESDAKTASQDEESR